MIIHINRQRFDFIRSGGYPFDLSSEDKPQTRTEGEVEYHVIEGERGHCETCKVEVDSVDANTPVELETIKMCRSFNRDPEPFLREARQLEWQQKQPVRLRKMIR